MNTLLRWDPFKTRWNPLKDRDELESRLATLFATREATGNGGKEAMTVAEWSPLVDIMEDEKEYLIKAELPDMKKEDVRAHGGERCPDDFRRTEIREGRQGHKTSSDRTGLRELHAELLASGGCGWEQGDGRL